MKLADTQVFGNDLGCTLVEFIAPRGYGHFRKQPGYAHLFEHMIIRSNEDYLAALEDRGIIINAETRAEYITFIFIDFLDGYLEQEFRSGRLASIFNARFDAVSLGNERGTIQQELAVYGNKAYLVADVDVAIGTSTDIEAFNLVELNAIGDSIAKCIIPVISLNGENASQNMIVPRLDFCPDSQDISAGWYRNAARLEKCDSDDIALVRTTRSWPGELIAFYLRMIYCNDCPGMFVATSADDGIKIQINESTRKLQRRLQRKELFSDRYKLMLGFLKFYMQEASYIARCLPDARYLREASFFTPWEEQLYEVGI